MSFSPSLQKKIQKAKVKAKATTLGGISFSSPFLLAPMSGICTPPFRLLMEELGAGGTVSELISCQGINYGQKKTLGMLAIDPREKNVGLQLFGENPEAMAKAASTACEFGPRFIDINMGCPVRKVITKGGGSALLRDTKKLPLFFSAIKKHIPLPLTIKIRTGYDEGALNASEVIHIAKEEGVAFVAIHGRTRAQQYRGTANWDYIETLAAPPMATTAPLPLVGNGDLHTPPQVRQRWHRTGCQALMLARGPLRHPFIFLEALSEDDALSFGPSDYWEVVQRLRELLEGYALSSRHLLIQMRKHTAWLVSGFPFSAPFKTRLFQQTQSLQDVMAMTENYFYSLGNCSKKQETPHGFMQGGHG